MTPRNLVRNLGRPPGTSAVLSPDDYDQLDESEFSDFQAWDRKRTNGGPYHMGEYSIAEVFTRLRWIKCYCIRLRQRLRESKSAHRLHELEMENTRLEIRLKRESVSDDNILREEVQRLRAENAQLQKYRRFYIQGDLRVRRNGK